MRDGARVAVERIVCDFEVAFHRAIEAVFPNRHVAILGCHFHFVQSLVRRLGALKLKTAYRDDGAFKNVVRLLKTIGFLPPPYVLQQYK